MGCVQLCVDAWSKIIWSYGRFYYGHAWGSGPMATVQRGLYLSHLFGVCARIGINICSCGALRGSSFHPSCFRVPHSKALGTRVAPPTRPRRPMSQARLRFSPTRFVSCVCAVFSDAYRVVGPSAASSSVYILCTHKITALIGDSTQV